MLAYEESVRWCDRALELVDAASARYQDLLLFAGEARLVAGDLERAREAYLEGAEIGRRRDDPELFARAALGFASGLSGFEVRLWDRVQTDLLEEALRRLGPDDAVRRAQVLARLSVALSFKASDTRRRELAEEAVDMARRLADPAALAGALAAHCDAVAGPAYVDLREQQAGEIVALARQVPDVGLELLGLRLRVIARLERGALTAARLDVAEFERLVTRLRQPFFSWYVVLWRGLEAHLAGDLDEMAACAEEVGRLAELGGSRNASVLSTVQGTWPLFERGRATEAIARLQAALGELPELTGRRVADPALPRAAFGGPVGGPAATPPDAGAPRRSTRSGSPTSPGSSRELWEQGVGGEPPSCSTTPWCRGPSSSSSTASARPASGPWSCCSASSPPSARSTTWRLATSTGLSRSTPRSERCWPWPTPSGSTPACSSDEGAADDNALRRSLLDEALAFYRRVGIAERVVEVEALLGPGSPGARATEPATGVFRRSGPFWTVGWHGREATLPAVKGMTDLAVLLAQPDREVHVLDLVGATNAPAGRPRRDHRRACTGGLPVATGRAGRAAGRGRGHL